MQRRVSGEANASIRRRGALRQVMTRGASGGVREGIGRPRNPLPYSRQLFAVLPSTLCRTRIRLRQRVCPSAVKSPAADGKESHGLAQRNVWTWSKCRTVQSKVPVRPPQSPRQPRFKSPSAVGRSIDCSHRGRQEHPTNLSMSASPHGTALIGSTHRPSWVLPTDELG